MCIRKRASLSDLASSCEYYTPEATCLAIAENPKAKANREARCLNDEKQSCCYICDSRAECAISCKYLGGVENQPETRNAPEPHAVKLSPEPKAAAPSGSTKNYPVVYCASCNVEMSPKSAKLKLEDSETERPKQFGDYMPQPEEVLSVIIYLCPLCGRIEFRSAK